MGRIKVLIQPLGNVSEEAVLKLTEMLNVKLDLFEAYMSNRRLPLSEKAYNPLRRQYHSPHILKMLCRVSENLDFDRILGVAEADLYVRGLNFIFGEAQLGGRCAIISLCRLKPEFYGERSNKKLFYLRMLKEAVHELGHTLGLNHCRNMKCVMYFSNSIWDTDMKDYRFCSQCREKIILN